MSKRYVGSTGLEMLCHLAGKIEITSTCWEWQGAKTWDYGVIQIRGVMRRAHRVMYEATIGPIGPEMVVDHLCKNRSCINPSHLEAVTIRENTMRGDSFAAKNSKKTHCLAGHEFTEANTLVSSTMQRCCRTCARIGARRFRARRKLRSALLEEALAAVSGPKVTGEGV